MEFRSLKYLKVAFFSLCLLLGSPVTNAQTASDSIKIHQTRYYNGISETMRSADLDKEPKVREYLFAGYKYKDYDSIISSFNKSWEFATSSGDDYFLSTIYYALAGTYVNMADEELALEYSNLLVELAKEHELSVYLFEGYRLLGVTYSYFLNDYDRALENYRQALNYATDEATSLRMKLDIAWMYVTANGESEDPNKYDVARAFLDDIKAHFDTVPSPTRYQVLHVAYGTNLCFSQIEEDYDAKIKYATLALEYAYVIDSLYTETNVISSALNTLAALHVENKKYELARSRIQEGLTLAKRYDDEMRINNSYTLLASIDYELKDYQGTIAHLDSVKRSNVRTEAVTIDSLYYGSYIQLKDYEKAVFHAQKYIAIRDSINKAEKQNAYVEFGKKYQTEKKIQENKILTQENQIKDLTINKEKNRRYFLSAISALAFLVLIVLYYFYRNKQKTAKILQQKNETISVQNDALIEANATKQKFFSIISHDLVNPFNAMLGYTQLLNSNYDDFDEAEKKEFIGDIHSSAAHNYKLVKSLLTWGRTQENTIVANKEELNCRDLIELACEPYLTFSRQKDIQIINEAPSDLSCVADKNMMITGIGNLVNNAIKFTAKGGVIQIEAHTDAGKVYFDIKDNGVGIPPEKMADLFAPDKVKSSRGTNDESGTGFGLMITREFMRKQGGDVLVAPNNPKGTIFTLVL